MKKLLLLISTLGLSATAFADSHKHMEYKTLSFDKGVTNLTAAQKVELDEIANKSNKDDRDVDLTVATWSDEPIPSKNKSLSATQREIADKRSKSIRDYFKQVNLDVDNYEVHNMAENPNFLARTFNTDDNQVKKVVKNEGVKDSDDADVKSEYRVIEEHGEEGKSVVIVRYDD